nr:MAG TPA: hypothetical protein [Crassvirales sp.]
MKFLDLNGLTHFWMKIKASFGTDIVITSECKMDSSRRVIIPFITNHQIVNINNDSTINVYDWFQKASKGGILEIVFVGIEGGSIFCLNNNKHYMRKMKLSSMGPVLDTITVVNIQYNNYVRLIKISNDTLFVAELVENK